MFMLSTQIDGQNPTVYSMCPAAQGRPTIAVVTLSMFPPASSNSVTLPAGCSMSLGRARLAISGPQAKASFSRNLLG